MSADRTDRTDRTDRNRADRNRAEEWFVGHGLPWFIDREDARIARLLTVRRLAPVLAGITVLALLVTGIVFAAALGAGDDAGPATGTGLVAGLWATVLLFSAAAVGFLLGQLPEQVRKVVEQVRDGGLAGACRQTPFEDAARDLGDRIEEVPLSSRQRVNLLLVLLIAQAVQVLLLAAAVFGFFLAFGLVAIGDEIIEVWTGAGPHDLRLWGSTVLGGPVSNELFQVSVFLAAFSGLYFTVYAVSDATYREQFFTRVSRDLERAIGVRAVYRALAD